MSKQSKQRLGKYFLLRLKANSHLVLEILDAADKPGAIVVAGEVQGEQDAKAHQLWFIDPTHKAIRNKLNNFSLDVDGDAVVVNPFNHVNNRQSWFIDGQTIRNGRQTDLVIGVGDESSSGTLKGGPCIASTYNDVAQQQWTTEFQPALFFHIKSHDDPRQVLDVQGADPKPGAKVIIYGNKGDLADNQLWYEDQLGHIRSKLNDFVFDASGKEVMLLPCDKNNVRQQWIIAGDLIQNRDKANEVLRLKPGNLFSSATLVPTEIKPTDTSTLHLWQIEFIPDQVNSLSHSGCGKHFIVRSRANGLVWEVQGQSVETGSPVAMAYRSNDASLSTRQHFYSDDVTGTIRSVLRNYCIDTGNDNLLTISPYDPYKKNQQWKVVGKKIQNRHNLNMVLEVVDISTTVGSRVSENEYTGQDGQHWEIAHVPARCFYIISQLCDKVLDVKGDKASAGSAVIIYDRKSEIAANQLWYEDEHGIVRCKLNGYVLDSSEGTVSSRPYDPSNKHQQWIIVGDRIQNKYDSKMVMDIKGASKRNGASLCEYKFEGSENQRWKFEYIKGMSL